MRILFSVYTEARETEERAFIYKKSILTDMKLEEIDNRLQLYDGFRSVLVAGRKLTFWDIYCFFDISQELIERINRIPLSQMCEEPKRDPNVFYIEEFDPGNADVPCYPEWSRCCIYRLERYECGASGYEAIVVWASNHPWLMVFIGGLIWDVAKKACLYAGKILQKVFRAEKSESTPKKRRKTVYFAAARFYRNFSQMANLDKRDCQIVYLKRIRGGNFEVHVRTAEDGYYAVKCSCHGKINYLKQENGQKIHKADGETEIGAADVKTD